MAKLAELRKKAKGLGISAAVLRGATTAPELQKIIADHGSKPRKKSAVKKSAPARKPARKATVAKKTAAKKSPGRKASTPAKSKGAKAKRSSNSTDGRNTLGKINFNDSEGWNPRSGSAPDLIIKALKKCKGDRTKAFGLLKGDIWNFVSKKKMNGTKRTKSEAESMLKYRISRTLFDFAIATGQHESSTNRVKYGTGGTGNGTFKPAKAKAAKKPAAAKKKTTAAKPARKAGGRKKAAGGRAKAKTRR
jgi:hypothetical protein